ncbi:MAG: hypothetical protein JST85_17530 [Acidobacteria bacterium]|nr:hypothetical protein [Acidobacteriota bacterium]
MTSFDRRSFLASISCSLAGTIIPAQFIKAGSPRTSTCTFGACWLELAAPFVVEDSEAGVECEIVLTSDTFAGVAGHIGGKAASEYEICLYDAEGRALGQAGVAKRLIAPAMQTTVIPVRELIGETKKFFGGLKIRLRPANNSAPPMPHASDLFSSAFVRWRTSTSFDNVHVNPDPWQWQNTDAYFYSMPFPTLQENECVFSLFNPNMESSAGEIIVSDPSGRRIAGQRYELKSHASLLFDLNTGTGVGEPWGNLKTAKGTAQNGLLAVTNNPGTTKSFGYLMIRRNAQKRFSVEHPIHQSVFKQKPAALPFDDNQQFKAKNVLYSPLLFRGKKFGNLTFDSRFYFGAGLPLEESLWLYPFAVDGQGEVAWSALTDRKLATALASQTERGVIRLNAKQSCALNLHQLSFDKTGFSGGLAVAVSPDTNHTLLKTEVCVAEWNAYAFTHFRPGLRSARLYQKPKERGGLATDYIASGARVVKSKAAIRFDELVGVINIDDQGLEANPILELFDSHGLVRQISLGVIPPFACRHYLLSELIPGEVSYQPLSLRLTDGRATLLMSVVHLDHELRDIALDHGSDRFSTFSDFICQ